MVKQQVLAALDAARGRYISGQELAARLGVSRTAVWKAVAALRSDGIPIEAVTNRGYTLSRNVDVLNTAAVAALLDAAPLQALQIEVVDRLPGTNAALRTRADAGAPEGLVLIAQVLGLGFNVIAPVDGWPEELRGVAGALYEGSPAPGARAALAAAFLNEFWPMYRAGSRSGYLDDYRRRQALVGRRVLVTPRSGAPRAALALGIDDECRMIVRYDGESRPAAVTSGEAGVRLL